MSGFKSTKRKFLKFFTIFIAVFMSAALIFAVGCSADSGDINGVEGSSSITAEENNSDEGDNTQEEENSDDDNTQEEVETDEGGIVIDTTTVTSTATFYDITIDGLTVEIFAVLASDNTVRVAFNTCQVCNGSKKAYFVQSGNYMVCQNCKSKISIDTVGKSSNSCSPVPVKAYSLSNGIITVSQTYLEGNVSLFKKWKDN
ncbi:MAG: DUF2318 domain-containing protein [Clostridia bacterium]|nr:DUF2318 domain-containing protein [Clostridia bacterium]